MTNKFNIDITANDKSSRVFNNLIGKGNRLDKSLHSVNTTAQRGAEIFRSMVPSMAALSGMGSIAGLGALEKKFSDSSIGLSNMADNLGLSTTKLQELHGAAKLTGLSVGSMDSGIKSLGTTMENAMFGRDNNALMLFKSLGIEMHKTAKGGPDTHRALLDVADAIAKIHNPQAQAALAEKFGISDLLPLLRKGSAGIRDLENQTEKLGYVQSKTSVQGGKSLYGSLTDLGMASEGLGNAIAAGLAPNVDKVAKGTGEWVMQHRSLISEDVAGWATDVGDAFGYAQGKTADLFEWMNKLTVAAGDKTNKDPTSLNFMSAWMNRYSQWLTGNDNETFMGMAGATFDEIKKNANPKQLASKGHPIWMLPSYIDAKKTADAAKAPSAPPLYSPKERTAFSVLMGTESAHRQVDKNGKPITSSAGAVGIAQVMPDTAREVARKNGIKWDEHKYKTDSAYNAQLGRLYFHQLLESYSGDYAKAYGAYNAGPGRLNEAQNEARKTGNVGNWLQYMPKETRAYVPKNMAALSKAEQGGTQQPIKVEVTLHNAPPGTKAHVSNVDLASVRINHAMPGASTP